MYAQGVHQAHGHRKLGESREGGGGGGDLSLTLKAREVMVWKKLKVATVPIIPSRIFDDSV